MTNGTNTIGYADASKAGDLGTVAKIKVGDEFVAVHRRRPLPRSSTSRRSSRAASANDLAIELDRTTTDPTPLPARPRLATCIVCVEYTDAAQGELVKAYFGYIIERRGPGRPPPSRPAPRRSRPTSSEKVADALSRPIK